MLAQAIDVDSDKRYLRIEIKGWTPQWYLPKFGSEDDDYGIGFDLVLDNHHELEAEYQRVRAASLQ